MTNALILAGCAVLAARPALLHAGPPKLVIIALFFGLLLASVSTSTFGHLPPDTGGKCPKVAGGRGFVVLVAGVAVFAVGRVVDGGHAPGAFTLSFVALNSLAAVAEEAFFRRLVYGALAPVGAAFAIGGAAALFALVHVTTYGAWVLPIDLAAGLLFGWQRWATQRWSVPAVTHVAANVLVVV